MQCWFFPTLLEGRQCLMSLDGDEATWDIEVDEDTIALRQFGPDATPGVLIVSPFRLRPDRWYFVAASIDVERGRAGLAAARAALPGHSSSRLETTWSERVNQLVNPAYGLRRRQRRRRRCPQAFQWENRFAPHLRPQPPR